MRVAKIFTTDGRDFVTNDFESLSKLEVVERIEYLEMEPEVFWRIPATSGSDKFFSQAGENG